MTITIEQAGHMLADPAAYTDEERLHRGFVGGLKHLPIRYKLRR